MLHSDELLITMNNCTYSTIQSKLSDRYHCNRYSNNPSVKQSYDNRTDYSNYERTGSKNEHDEEEKRDEVQNSDQLFKYIQNSNLNESEVAGKRFHLQAKEREKTKEILKRKTISKLDGTSKHHTFLDTIYNSESKYSGTTALDALGKNNITVSRDLAATKLKVNKIIVYKESATLSERTITLHELDESRIMTNRELAAPRLHVSFNRTIISNESARLSKRLIALYELGKSRVIINRKLAVPKLHESNNTFIVSNKSAKTSERLIALYELGKRRVTTNRELAVPKKLLESNNRLLVSNESAKTSDRIVGLYELGKYRVTKDRELATPKILESNNRLLVSNESAKTSERIVALYELGKNRVTKDRELAASRSASRRLFVQAQLREKRSKRRKEIISATRPPQIKLAIHQRIHKNAIDREMSPTGRFYTSYKRGKNQVIADIELEIDFLEKKMAGTICAGGNKDSSMKD